MWTLASFQMLLEDVTPMSGSFGGKHKEDEWGRERHHSKISTTPSGTELAGDFIARDYVLTGRSGSRWEPLFCAPGALRASIIRRT